MFNKKRSPFKSRNHLPVIFNILLILILISACVPEQKSGIIITPETTQPPTAVPGQKYAPRPHYSPGELVDYIAQTGDTLPGLAGHFNTTEKEIRQANPDIPSDATTMPPGFPMKIPIYYLPLWGSPVHILPDEAFVNGPSLKNFNARDFVDTQPGWFKDYEDNAAGELKKGGDLVDHVADNFSISPKLLLAILEYQTGALTNPQMPDFNANPYPLGYEEMLHKGVYQQLVWAANTLNNGYYGWRAGTLTIFEKRDKTLERPDPWLNAATTGLHYYFGQVYGGDNYDQTILENGFLQAYERLFGKYEEGEPPLIPGSLVQPPMFFPFVPNKIWAYTGGPHAGWGNGQPFAAIDFAPASIESGCAPSTEWVTAVADGVVTRSDHYRLDLDLDGDGNNRTGWVIFYLHLSGVGMPGVGSRLKAGDYVGHPSCEGGEATGTHVHIARKYNGEWVLAGGRPAFNLEGWAVHDGDGAYSGTMTNFAAVITANVNSEADSQIKSTRNLPKNEPKPIQ